MVIILIIAKDMNMISCGLLTPPFKEARYYFNTKSGVDKNLPRFCPYSLYWLFILFFGSYVITSTKGDLLRKISCIHF